LQKEVFIYLFYSQLILISLKKNVVTYKNGFTTRRHYFDPVVIYKVWIICVR